MHRTSRIGEGVGVIVSRRARSWIAYRHLRAKITGALRCPEYRITSTKNAIDTSELAEASCRLIKADIDAVRSELTLMGSNVCVFAGLLYLEKRLSFLLGFAQ